MLHAYIVTFILGTIIDIDIVRKAKNSYNLAQH